MSYSFMHSASIIYPNIARAVIPSSEDIISFAQALFACVVFMLLGRLVIRKHAIAEISLFVGSALAMVLLFVAVQAGVGLYHARIGLCVSALISLGIAWREKALTREAIANSIIFRVFVAATPLWFGLISLSLWQSDTLNSWIPNYQYLAMHHAFPGSGDVNSAIVNSLLCFPLLGYVGSIIAVSPKILMHLNILFCLTSLAFLLRIRTMLPCLSWRLVVLAVPLFFALNYHYPILFSSYADLLMSILLGVIIYAHACMEKGVMSPRQAWIFFSILLLLAAEITLMKASGVSVVLLWFASVSGIYGLLWIFDRQAYWMKKMLLPLSVMVAALGIWAGMQCWLTHIDARNQVTFLHSPAASAPPASAPVTSAPATAPAPPVSPPTVFEIIQEVLAAIAASPVMALVFCIVMGVASFRLLKRDRSVDSLLLYACALLIVSYISLRILIFATVMQGVVTSEQRYAYHLFYAALVTLALTMPNTARIQRWQQRAIQFFNRTTWTHVIIFYVVFLALTAPFLRSDVRERKLFMHALARHMSQAMDHEQGAYASYIRVYFNKDAPHATHYAMLLRGLLAVKRPADVLEIMDMRYVIPEDELRLKEFARQEGYVIAFCVKEGDTYQAHLIGVRGATQQLLNSYALPKFNDSKVQICD